MLRSPHPARRAEPGRRIARSAAQGALALAIMLMLLAAVSLLNPPRSEIEGVATINDGDTLTVAGARVRLRGIDAPELDQTCRRNGAAYACGREARARLRALAGGATVRCAADERDRYGRLLALCSAGGEDLNRRMVAEGWAVAYGAYIAEEAVARTASRGLWAGEFDRPRSWRNMHGAMADIRLDPIGRIVDGWLRRIGAWFGGD